MSADQLKRAADAIEQSEPVLRVVRADGELTNPDAAVAALLRVNAVRHRPELDDFGGGRLVCSYCGDDVPWPCPDAQDATLVAAAYLGEDPQP